MTGERDLDKMLLSLAPELLEGEYVFCTVENARYGDNLHLVPMAAIVEREGLTLVIPRLKADEHSIHYESVFRCITLNVHSSLDAVGLTATVATRLAERGISANVIAGYFHDHIFVPLAQAENALAVLGAGDE
ncbi:MAG: ACT domain-containing protein [Halioglobus sp.]